MNPRIAIASTVLLAATSLAHADVCAERTRTYSMPFGDPVLAVCCTEGTPPVVLAQAVPSSPGAVAAGGPVTTVDPATAVTSVDPATEVASADPVLEIADRIQRRVTGEAASCRRYDDLTPKEKLAARLSLSVLPGGGCQVIATQYDHFICTCDQTCDRVEWECNCPGVEPGALPSAAPEAFPQDSYRSKPELVGETCSPCSAGSTCCNN